MCRNVISTWFNQKMMIDKRNVLFVEKVTLFSLLRLAPIGRSFDLILYFDPITPRLLKMLKGLREIGLISGEVRQIDHHIGQVRNEQGESEFTKLIGYARGIVRDIKQREFVDNPLLKGMGSAWNSEKVQFYFERLIEQEITKECLRIGLVDWLLRKGHYGERKHSILMIRKGPWHSYLAAYAEKLGVKIADYPDFNLAVVSNFVSRLRSFSRRLLPAPGILVKRIFSRIVQAGRYHKVVASRGEQSNPASTIAIRYYHRTLGFSDMERTEFFWLTGTDVPSEKIILYDYATNKPLDPDLRAELKKKGITILGKGPGIRSWYPGRIMYTTAAHSVIIIILSILKCLMRGRKSPVFVIGHLFRLAVEYAYWYDFYKSNRIKLNITTSFNTSVAQVLALDHLNGISMAYQYTVSNLLAPTSLLSAGENVQFVFSALFEQMWRSIGGPVDQYVHTGFIYDGAIRVVRNSERALEIRKGLGSNGAKFIICFFDENSVNRWDILNSDEDAVRDYEFLLKWLLSDPGLGVVFKPKNSMYLFQRLKSIEGLIERVSQTGRCLFLTSDTLYGSIYPSEAAIIADLCVGKLLGATVSLEAFLTGRPTLLMDSDGFSAHPFQIWGRGRIIFDNWDLIRTAIDQYRESPQKNPHIGNWSPEIGHLDPFQDGQASQRMGNYVSWLYEALKKSLPRKEAMAEAAGKYAAQWGESCVTYNNIKDGSSF